MKVPDSAAIDIQRWPCEPSKEISHYEVPIVEDMTVLQALNYVYDHIDSTLAFRRYCCGGQFCNSCMLEINGKVVHACITKIRPGDSLLLRALPGRTVIKDLVVDPASNR